MTSLLSFDEANVLLPYKKRAIPFEEYFKGLPDGRGEKRQQMAEVISRHILSVLSLAYVYALYGLMTQEWLHEQLREAYISALIECNIKIDDYISKRADAFAQMISDNTADHLPNINKEEKAEDEWYTSPDRSDFIGENEADYIGEYQDFIDALEAGYTHKTWNTMLDNRVRDKHVSTEGQTVEIMDYFLVGDEYGMFPRDYEHLSDDNTVNCRCFLTFS